MVVTVRTLVCLLVACTVIILTIKLVSGAMKHRATRIMLLIPLVTTLAAGGLLLFSSGPRAHRLQSRIGFEPSSPQRALREAAATVRRFARDGAREGRIAAHQARVILKGKAGELRHSVTSQEYEGTLSAESTADCDEEGNRAIAMIETSGPPALSVDRRVIRGSWLWILITATAIGAFLYVGYILLDAGTRGHFSWPLRFAAVSGFGVIYAALTLLRH